MYNGEGQEGGGGRTLIGILTGDVSRVKVVTLGPGMG